jgi:two-component system sensor histidine kinase SenX3
MRPSRTNLSAAKEYGGDADLVRDALASARRLADEHNGSVAASALLAATVRAVRNDAFRWPLRLAQANYEAALGGRDAGIAAIRSASEGDHAVDLRACEFEGVRYPEAVLAAAAEWLGPVDPPAWFEAEYKRCLERPALLDDGALDRIDRALAPRFATRMRPARRIATLARDLNAANLEGHIGTMVMTIDESGRPVIDLFRSMAVRGDVWALLAGEIPPSVVDERLVPEARALASEAGVATVRLATVEGQHALDTRGAGADAAKLVVESVPLAAPLTAWRAEAVVAPDSGVPTTAWLLGAALLVTTAALLAGTLALRRAAERSARLAEDRQTFLDHVAHELRTPAAAVQALTEELASGHVAPEKEPQYRAHLLRESRRLSALVEDTLDLTRLDAGRLAFKMEPADLRDVVRRAIEESDGAGRVVATLPDAAVVRPVDEGTLRRAVKNLVENAVRHGGGEKPVTVALEASDGHASIVVADQGRGIAAAHLPRLFERFYRVPSKTHEVKGVGLGLALCREVARAHGGDVTVASRVGHGSTFTLRIPLA